ncbi:MAG: AAA family ATPase [Bacilli bacterium]|nr:AAA family ATPase [Bacilli bacterium]
MKKIIFISAVSGVGKSTICEYINNNNILDNYIAFDIDDLENINEYNKDTYNDFYKNAVNKAIEKAKEKNIIIGACINPTDINNLDIPKEIDINMILITCSNKKLERRLKERDKNRNCSSDEFIKGQIDYQDYLSNHLDMYQLHINNSNSNIEDISYQIVDFIKENNKVKK